MTMKKNIFLSLFVSNLLFAQNSILSDANGTQALQKIIGIGSSTIYNGVFTTKSSQYITSGTVSSDIAVAAVNVVATNSTHRNTAIMGISGGNGGSDNYGVIGFTNSVGSGESYGGFFNVGGGSTGTKYGISASITNIVPSTYAGVAGHFTNIGNSSVNNMGISSSVDNQGQGDAIAGYFKSFNALNNSGFRYGIISEATGPGVNYGLKTVAAGGNKNIGGYFLSHSDPLNNSYQLVLEETAADFVRISFGNSNGQGWHQAVFRGTTASNSLFNFYYAPNGIDILSLIGDGNATLAGLLTQSSDIRLKKNIQKMSDISQKINQIRGVYFDWKDTNRSQNQQIGFIAQEIEKVFPQLVETDAKGYKSVAYANMTAVLLEALKEQNKRIEYLEKEILAIKNLSNLIQAQK